MDAGLDCPGFEGALPPWKNPLLMTLERRDARSEEERVRFSRMDADVDWPGFEGAPPPWKNPPYNDPGKARAAQRNRRATSEGSNFKVTVVG